MSSRLFRSAFSQEDNQPTIEQIDPLKAELALESAAVEIGEAGYEVQMAELQQEELEHAHASLESIAFSLESLLAKDERGLDRVSAEGYQHAVSAILGDSLPNPVASLESFGGESECAEATTISLEGMKETLAKIWEGIKRSIQNAMRATADFFAKLFGGVDKLQDRIKAMQDDVSAKMKDGSKASGKFKVPGTNAVHLGGKVDAKVLEDGSRVVMDNVAGGADALQEAAVDYYKGLADFYAKKPEDTDKLEDEHKKAADKISKIKLTTGELPGGKQFEVESKTKGDMETVGVPKLVDFPGKKNAPTDLEVDVFDLKWIEKMLKEAEKFTAELAKKKSRREALKSAREETVKAAEKFVGDADKLSEKAAEKWTQTKMNWAMKSANKDFSSTIARVDGYVFSYVRAMLAVLNAALGKYGETSKEDASQEELTQEEKDAKAAKGDEETSQEDDAASQEDDASQEEKKGDEEKGDEEK